VTDERLAEIEAMISGAVPYEAEGSSWAGCFLDDMPLVAELLAEVKRRGSVIDEHHAEFNEIKQTTQAALALPWGRINGDWRRGYEALETISRIVR
jgi:hypothetical protein